MQKTSVDEIERRRKQAAKRALEEARLRKEALISRTFQGTWRPQRPRTHTLRRLGKKGIASDF